MGLQEAALISRLDTNWFKLTQKTGKRFMKEQDQRENLISIRPSGLRDERMKPRLYFSQTPAFDLWPDESLK